MSFSEMRVWMHLLMLALAVIFFGSAFLLFKKMGSPDITPKKHLFFDMSGLLSLVLAVVFATLS